ncbi:hypothetical protein AMECASPLE_018970 [Ameca splendens]|uniref:Uncharacterized protein n=1 Tax=Ameca splendens TaxID=208324 RepID=A0ABV1AAM6_9TELE
MLQCAFFHSLLSSSSSFPYVISSVPHPTIHWNPSYPNPVLSLSFSFSLHLLSYLSLSPLHLTSSKPEHPSSSSWIVLVHFVSLSLFLPLTLSLHPLVSPPHPFYLFLPALHSSSAARSSQARIPSSNH